MIALPNRVINRIEVVAETLVNAAIRQDGAASTTDMFLQSTCVNDAVITDSVTIERGQVAPGTSKMQRMEGAL